MDYTTIETPFGRLLLWSCGILDGTTHVAVRTMDPSDERSKIAEGCADRITIRGVDYRLRLDVYVKPDGTLATDPKCSWRDRADMYLDRKDWSATLKSPSDAARRKVRETLDSILRGAPKAMPDYFMGAELARATQKLHSMVDKVADAEKTLEEAHVAEREARAVVEALEAQICEARTLAGLVDG